MLVQEDKHAPGAFRLDVLQIVYMSREKAEPHLYIYIGAMVNGNFLARNLRPMLSVVQAVVKPFSLAAQVVDQVMLQLLSIIIPLKLHLQYLQVILLFQIILIIEL